MPWRKKPSIYIDNLDTIEDSRESTAEAIDREYALKELTKAVNRLPKGMKQVVELRFISGLSSKQVAFELDLSESNVRVIQYRALKKLKDYLK